MVNVLFCVSANALGLIGWYGGCGRARRVCGAVCDAAPGWTEVIWPLLPKKGTRNPTRLATRRNIFVRLGAREPSEAGRGPAGAAGPGLVPHGR